MSHPILKSWALVLCLFLNNNQSLAQTDQIQYAGRSLPRMAAPALPLTSGQAKFLDGFYSLVAEQPRLLGIKDFRSAQEVDEAREKLTRQSFSLGDVVLVRTQDFNLTPSLASLISISRHVRHAVVIVYHGQGKLRPLQELDGVVVPATESAKIFAIGNPQRDSMPFTKASDDFIEALQALSTQLPLAILRKWGELDLTVFSHGAGVLDAILTRKRLLEATGQDPFNTLFAFSFYNPLKVDPPFIVKMARTMMPYRIRVNTGGKDYADTLDSFDPSNVQKYFEDNDFHRYVDFSIAGVIGPAVRVGSREWRESGLIPAFRIMAILSERDENCQGGGTWCTLLQAFTLTGTRFLKQGLLLPGSERSNGAVALKDSYFGMHHYIVPFPTDHNSLWADFRAMENVLNHYEHSI